MTTIDITTNDLTGYIGRPYSDLPDNVTVYGAYPVVDRDTMTITGVVAGEDAGGYDLAELRDGEIVTGDWCSAFLVKSVEVA